MLVLSSAFWLALVTSAGAAEPTVAGATNSPCSTPDFSWLKSGRIEGYGPTFQACGDRLAIRQFRKQGHRYLLLVDPNTLQTGVAPAACQACALTDESHWSATPLLRALDELLRTETGIENIGVRHSLRPVEAVFLTVDLCPSRRPDFDEEIFTALEALRGTARGDQEGPIPVGVSISGKWLRHHLDAFRWLQEAAHGGELEITWINHTLTHPYDPRLPIAHNFMLEKGVNLDREILGLERLLLEHGSTPSVFFRFPGLVGNAELVEKLRRYYLLPIGSDAWLAKGQGPTPGSIILIHGNENEPVGVRDFLRWLPEPGRPGFLPVAKSFLGR